MIIRFVRHRGLKRLIEDNQTKGLRPDLVNRVRNILTALVVAEEYEDVPGLRPSWLAGPSTLRRSQGDMEHLHIRKLADHL